MATVLYRKDGGEVIKISKKDQGFEDADPDFYGVMKNPRFWNGTDIRQEALDPRDPNAEIGPLRQEGFAKIAIPRSNLVRNATSVEISMWKECEQREQKGRDCKSARERITTDPIEGRLFSGLLKLLALRLKEDPVDLKEEWLNLIEED